MAWEAVQFRDQDGNDVPEETREALLALIEKGLNHPDVDPDSLINAASTICANIGSVRNLSAYANRSIFRAVKKSFVAEKKFLNRSEPLPEDRQSSDAPSPYDSVDDQILLQQVMEKLDGLEREIYERHLKGYSFSQIDKQLRLKSRTSEYKYREAQLRLRGTLPPRP